MAEEIVDGELHPVRLDQVQAETMTLMERAMDDIQAIEVRSTIITTWVQRGLAQTAPHHWLDYGDQRGVESSPRPQDEAAIALARVLGASWRWIPWGDGEKYKEEAIRGTDHLEVSCQIEVRCLGATIQEEGSATTDDGLLSSGPRARDGHARMSDVRKKAMANALVRGLLAAGLRPVTWGMLEKAGIKRSDVPKVGFRESEATAAKGALADIAKTLKCPECGKPMRVRTSAKGEFLGCTGYPSCKATLNPEAAQKLAPQPKPPEPAEAPAHPPTNGKSALIRRLKALVEAREDMDAQKALQWAGNHFQRDVAAFKDLSEEQLQELIAELETPAEAAGQQSLDDDPAEEQAGQETMA